VLNNAMYALACKAGLSAAIANPAMVRAGESGEKGEIFEAAVDVLLGRDQNCARWIALQEVQGAQKVQGVQGTRNTLADAILHGLKDDARKAAEEELASGRSPMDVIQSVVVPALEEVGKGFEKGTVYLPQLLMSADAAGEAFAVVKRSLANTSQTSQTSRTSQTSPVILATVRGDIHDIGKNIVRALLENYGFDVVDLGRDVPPEKIVETAKKTGAKLVGLSALMTTTVGAMQETIRQLKAAGLGCKTVVGGAVVAQEFADSIGADFYAKDAMRTVRIAEQVLSRKGD